MSDFELYSWGSLDCSDLKTFNPRGPFCIAVEFDIRYKNETGAITFCFFLCNQEGFTNNFRLDDDLEDFKHTIIVEKYSYDYIVEHFKHVIEHKIKTLSNIELMQFLHENYFEDK